MKTLREVVADAKARNVAVGHFNISNIEGLWAIVNGAAALKVPVIVGVSEGERDFVGAKEAAVLVKSVREQYDMPIFINADHTYSFERVKEAIDLGYDSVIFDGAKLSLEENLANTKRCVEYARSVGREVLVEAELGYIGQSSKILDEAPEGAALSEADLTTPEQAKQFVFDTGIDFFSPAIGSIHGMLRSTNDPDLNIARIKEISAAISTPLVLHGASGLREENVKEAIAAGISIVHINTELRVAYRDALKLSLQANPDEVAPYKIMKPVVAAMQKVVEAKLKLFNNL